VQNKHVAIIGAGPAGMGAASALAQTGIKVTVFDKENHLGGHLAQWKTINPQITETEDVINSLKSNINWESTSVQLGKEVQEVKSSSSQKIDIVFANGEKLSTDAVIYSGGYQLFDASKKEELGYGIYPRVITSADLEMMLKGERAFPVDIQQIGIVHCVGSRDTKVNNTYCSKMCCMVGVKQAIELKKHFPEARVMNFYMDLRMFGQGYEELYLKAQKEFGVQFVRGRVSEVSEQIDGSLQLKAEDTLMGKPIRGRFDLLVLMVGMEGAQHPIKAEITNNQQFISPNNSFVQANSICMPGVFVAGSCKGPSSASEAYNDGHAAAVAAINFLTKN
jgi:heterodisulfide reductase subunit A